MLWDPKKDLSQTSQDLLAAADYIERHGWCQGKMIDKDGRVCVVGALASVITAIPAIRAPRIKVAQQALVSQLRMPVTIWNDQPGNTQEKVLKLLKTVARFS